ncbi:MAG TPA: hypothetical protein VF832_02790 [Longimicrobiales bacterium]
MPASPGDDAESDVVALDWHLEIFGYQPRPARLEAVPRSKVRRAISAAAALVFWCTLAPLAILMPPHFDPAVVTILVGIYMARVYWNGRYRARSLRGTCPRCGQPLRLRAGTLLRVPHPVHCRHCGDTPHLAPGPADDAAGGRITRGARALTPEEARAADAAWRRRRAKLSPSSWSPASGDWAPGKRTTDEDENRNEHV